MSSTAGQEWFEGVWADREESVFPRLFGPQPRGVFTLSPSIFLETFKQASFDPRWLHYGVFEFRPTSTRSSWLYVTSGMSNAWGDDEPHPDGPSGFGCELEQGGDNLVQILTRVGGFPVTDSRRKSAVPA
jgi:hypothetical protein